jgi:hypothetical protein
VDLRRLQLSLFAAQLIGAATLLRSVAYNFWITMLASVLLIAGAEAARRGRSWGVGLALGAGSAFLVAFAIGIAPAWFVLVGLAGALPFAIASRAFARFDKGATALLALLAASAGTIGAMGWKEYAWSIFAAFPMSRPSLEAQQGLMLATLTTLVAAAFMSRGKHGALASGHGVRVAEHIRVADSARHTDEGLLEIDPLEHESDDASLAPAQRRGRLP